MNVPMYAVICIVVMVIAAVVLLLFANPATTPSLPLVIGLLVTTIPSLVAAVFSERASRDIRNGVMKDKVKEALDEKSNEQGMG